MVNTGQCLEKNKIKEIVRKVFPFYQQLSCYETSYIIDEDIERSSFALATEYFGLETYDIIHTQDVISTRGLWRIKPKDTPFRLQLFMVA